MVKLRGPMSSVEASGRFGGAAIMSSWKGRAYAKAHAIPTNPQTATQTGVRVMLGFLAQQWASLTTADKATWENLAAQTNIPPYNAFISANLNRWTRFQPPTQATPATQTGTLGNLALYSATPNGSTMDVYWRVRDKADGWLFMLFRNETSPVPLDRDHCIAVLDATADDYYHFYDENLEPGTYYYNGIGATVDGKIGAAEGEVSGTIT